MTQFQINRADLNQTRFVERPQVGLVTGEIRVRIEKFGFSANNVTYAVAGETLGYWKFFKADENQGDSWGVLPVWGFAEVTETLCEGIDEGERLFGYFPPSSSLILQPGGVKPGQFYDAAEHRSELPRGYNVYRRLAAEPGYDPAHDAMRMLLYPLYLTSYVIWDQLKEHDWYGAEQIIIGSASSKTSIGLAYALFGDKDAPKIVGLTSKGNQTFVDGLKLYDSTVTYEEIEENISSVPTAIVDMSGNAEVIGRLHEHLGDDMKHNIDVGLTHWEGARKDPRIIRDRREFFFAPSRIQQRNKDWGPEEFTERSSKFIMDASIKSRNWLELKHHTNLADVEAVYKEVLHGKAPADKGIVFEL